MQDACNVVEGVARVLHSNKRSIQNGRFRLPPRFDFISSDPLFGSRWHLSAPRDGTDLVRDAGISAPGAWVTTRGVRDVVIRVADQG